MDAGTGSVVRVCEVWTLSQYAAFIDDATMRVIQRRRARCSVAATHYHTSFSSILPLPVHPSVRPSVCLSTTIWIDYQAWSPNVRSTRHNSANQRCVLALRQRTASWTTVALDFFSLITHTQTHTLTNTHMDQR